MTRHRKRRQWGSGEIHQTSSGWQVRWRENGLRRTRGGFATREDAERVLAKMRGDMAQHRAGLPPDPRGLPTLSELVPDILDRRKLTHRTADCDRYRWKKHIEPHFGHLKPSAVDVARIRAFVEVKLAEKLNPATIRIFIALLSAVFVDLTKRGLATGNPARGLPTSLMRLIRPTHDPKKTPFIERLDDVRGIFLALPEPLNVAYAIGALAGLRTGEVFALRWEEDRQGHAGKLPPRRPRTARARPARPRLVRGHAPHLRVAVGAGRQLDREAVRDPGPLLRRDDRALRTSAAGAVHAGRPRHDRHRSAEKRCKLGELGHRMATDPSNPNANHLEQEENGQSRPVSRVLSPRPVAGAGEADIPLGPALPRASSEPTREHGGPPLPLEAALPYLLLLRVGLAVPPPSPAARCALAAPFHPCLPFGRRSVLCGAVPRVASAGR